MNILKADLLSNRLASVASFVKQDAVVADIGSDHAYLPCYLVLNGTVKRAVAGEVVKGPYESAVRNVRRKGLADSITVRLANGLHAIELEDAIDTVTIAGMGGTLIASILEQGASRLVNVERIIVQPNIHAKAIREWAVANEWMVVEEDILKEDDKIYEVLVLERGHAEYDEIELLVGPYLRKTKKAAFNEKWLREIQEWKRVLESLDSADKTEAIELKQKQLRSYVDLIRKVLSS